MIKTDIRGATLSKSTQLYIELPPLALSVFLQSHIIPAIVQLDRTGPVVDGWMLVI